MLNRKNLSKIGIGTWGIGGFAQRNPDNDDEKQTNALTYMLTRGLNYVELNEWTGDGHSVELVAKALEKSGIKRDKVFLSQAIYSYTASTLEAAKKELARLLILFKTAYVDSISLNEAAIKAIDKKVVLDWYQDLLDSNKVRYINLNNPSLETAKEFKQKLGDKLFSVEIGFNFEVRENLSNGIIDYASTNNILCVVYQPLRRNRTAQRNWPLLVELAGKYGKTQNQIILNWICSHGLLPLTKSETISHIDEHLQALSFKIEETDLKKIDEFFPAGYRQPQAYYGSTGDGVRIDQLSNVFDDEYDKQVRH